MAGWGVAMLWGPLGVLAALCAAGLVKLPSAQRRGLLSVTVGMTALAAVLFGGAWLLEQNDLSWRTVPQEIMSFALWGLGLTAGVLTVWYTARWASRRWPKGYLWLQALGIGCLLSVMWVGTILGGLWAMGPGEQVGTWHGQRVVQGKWTFMETSYSVYEYHGPLVRGRELAWGEAPLLDGAEDAW